MNSEPTISWEKALITFCELSNENIIIPTIDKKYKPIELFMEGLCFFNDLKQNTPANQIGK